MLKDTYVHKGLRKSLIENLQKKGISSLPLLQAFQKVPRHFFLDSTFSKQAYQDIPFSIGNGQTISQPYTVAFQTQLLEVSPGDKVLEIGSGSGFQSCILLALGVDLYSLEVIPELHEKAKKMANLLNLDHRARFLLADGTQGFASKAPFHKILVTAGAPIVPSPLIEQLTIGGILVIPVGSERTQKMLRITKISEKQLKKEEFGDFCFVKLKGENGWK